jgi:hypothetical protein
MGANADWLLGREEHRTFSTMTGMNMMANVKHIIEMVMQHTNPSSLHW